MQCIHVGKNPACVTTLAPGGGWGVFLRGDIITSQYGNETDPCIVLRASALRSSIQRHLSHLYIMFNIALQHSMNLV